MTLADRHLRLQTLVLKDRPVLGLDTGVDADSLEGLRLVKASRGQGWFWDGASIRPWVTRGVHQAARRLVVWGEVEGAIPPGATPEAWPLDGPEGRDFVAAFVRAWTARAALPEALGPFTASALLPLKTEAGWAFAFPPDDLRAVLDSLQPLGDRLAWEHLRHPDAGGAPSWAFASAALALRAASGTLPWVQDDEEHLRQELRDLKRTFSDDELPADLGAPVRALWSDSLTQRIAGQAAPRWAAWAASGPLWAGAEADPTRRARGEAARQRRLRRRCGAAFWRRRGTQLTALGVGLGLLVLIVGSVVWGAVKPDPTDLWGPEQVVRGYYAGLTDLDSEQMRKVTRYDASRQPDLERDKAEATNLYVIRQVRTAYERKSPVLNPEDWEAAGKPALVEGQMLYGVAGLEVTGADGAWTARYRKWVHEGGGEEPVRAVGFAVEDHLTLTKTSRGWKVSGLTRTRQPLP